MLAVSDAIDQSIASASPVLVFLWIAALVAMHIAIAIAIGADARARVQSGAPLFFGLSGVWGGIALFTGLFGLGTYWVLHYSRLSVAAPTDGTSGPAHDPRR